MSESVSTPNLSPLEMYGMIKKESGGSMKNGEKIWTSLQIMLPSTAFIAYFWEFWPDICERWANHWYPGLHHDTSVFSRCSHFLNAVLVFRVLHRGRMELPKNWPNGFSAVLFPKKFGDNFGKWAHCWHRGFNECNFVFFPSRHMYGSLNRKEFKCLEHRKKIERKNCTRETLVLTMPSSLQNLR